MDFRVGSSSEEQRPNSAGLFVRASPRGDRLIFGITDRSKGVYFNCPQLTRRIGHYQLSQHKWAYRCSFFRPLALPNSGGEHINAHYKQYAKTDDRLPWIQPRRICADPAPIKCLMVPQRDACSKKTGKTSHDSNQRYWDQTTLWLASRHTAQRSSAVRDSQISLICQRTHNPNLHPPPPPPTPKPDASTNTVPDSQPPAPKSPNPRPASLSAPLQSPPLSLPPPLTPPM